MAVKHLELHDHPTVITTPAGAGAFEGWGVRIG